MEIDDVTLRACQRGDARAFRRLVELYQQPVFALCVALAGSDGEDLAQETFMRVHGAIERFDVTRPESLKSWILTIARRLCTDRARHLRLNVEVAVPPPDVADPAAGPEAQLDAAVLDARFRVALAALPAEQRAVIALFEWEGLPYDEIATIEGVPVGTVRSRLARARAALRAALGEPAEAAAAAATAAASAGDTPAAEAIDPIDPIDSVDSVDARRSALVVRA